MVLQNQMRQEYRATMYDEDEKTEQKSICFQDNPELSLSCPLML